MRKLCFLLLLGAALASPSRAEPVRPDGNFVVAMAQHLMVAEMGDLARASFGPTELHPQPTGDYWAVVGEFQSKAMTGRMTTHWYVAAVRLICADFKASACWRLEKAAVDGKLVIERRFP